MREGIKFISGTYLLFSVLIVIGIVVALLGTLAGTVSE